MHIFTLEDLASPDYRAMLNSMHVGTQWGNGGAQQLDFFMPLVTELGCKTFLDYGCGKGKLKEVLPNLDVRLFDPGNPEFDKLPQPADFVTALSCIENIEPAYVMNVLAHIYSLVIKGAYLSITLRLGRSNDLPDGRNEHLSVHPAEWWLAKLDEFDWTIKKQYVKGKALRVWLVKPLSPIL